MHTKTRLVVAAVMAAAFAAFVGWTVLEAPTQDSLEAPAPAPALAQATPNLVTEPLPSRPSQALVQLVESAAQGQPTPFLAELIGKIPTGQVNLSHADQVDAGAEEGHAVPVTLWIDGQDAVAALQGTARFQREGAGYRVAALTLQSLPLKVGSWSAARAASSGLTGGARDAESPFYGLFRFGNANRRVIVDAISGTVEVE